MLFLIEPCAHQRYTDADWIDGTYGVAWSPLEDP
jgi:hypothetical protein